MPESSPHRANIASIIVATVKKPIVSSLKGWGTTWVATKITVRKADIRINRCLLVTSYEVIFLRKLKAICLEIATQ